MTAFPSILSLTNRVLNECGVPSVSSNAATSNTRSALVVNAANDCAVEVYSRSNHWPWVKTTTFFPLAQGVVDYSLPVNFGTLLDAFINARKLTELQMREYGNLILAGSTPYTYAVENGALKLGWSPSSAEAGSLVRVLYAKAAPDRRTSDTDSLDLPGHFLPMVVMFCRARLKNFLESDDWQTDMAEYARLLQIQMNAMRQSSIQSRARLLGC